MDSNDQNYGRTGQTGSTGTATQTETGKLQVVTDETGAVRIGAWKNLPVKYTPLQTKDEIVQALQHFNANELREQIANICVGEF